MPISTSASSVKLLRNTIVVLVIVAICLYIALFFFSKKPAEESTSSAEESTSSEVANQEEVLPTVTDQYPKETAFIEEYFALLQKQDYATLVKSYWLPSVVSEIRQHCSSPLGEDPSTTTESLWRTCEHLDNVLVEIISVKAVEDGSIVTVQFFDEDNTIVGLELHPEWVRGHQVYLKQTQAGLRTDNWNFL